MTMVRIARGLLLLPIILVLMLIEWSGRFLVRIIYAVVNVLAGLLLVVAIISFLLGLLPGILCLQVVAMLIGAVIICNLLACLPGVIGAARTLLLECL